MRGWFESARNRRLGREVKRLTAQLADVRNELESEKRRNAVQQAEIDSMAAVIVRDRERVKVETAIAAMKIAEGKK